MAQITETKKADLPIKLPNAMGALAAQLSIDPGNLKQILKNTVCAPMKVKDGKYREISDEEFMAFAAVCSTYKLNPLTKEIYAYPDVKQGKIVPVVSTDGWSRLMLSHRDYVTHEFVYSDNIVELKGAKPCPEWCEIHIHKANGSVVKVREYLDECFRSLDYASPWQTHTKRMLRHKVKIQGAREAFGFCGIYDEDEAVRIVEAETVRNEPRMSIGQLPQVGAIEVQPDPEPMVTPAMEAEYNNGPQPPAPQDPVIEKMASESQVKAIHAICRSAALDVEEELSIMGLSWETLTSKQASNMIKHLQQVEKDVKGQQS